MTKERAVFAGIVITLLRRVCNSSEENEQTDKSDVFQPLKN
jgi:hypothetical protein